MGLTWRAVRQNVQPDAALRPFQERFESLRVAVTGTVKENVDRLAADAFPLRLPQRPQGGAGALPRRRDLYPLPRPAAGLSAGTTVSD